MIELVTGVLAFFSAGVHSANAKKRAGRRVRDPHGKKLLVFGKPSPLERTSNGGKASSTRGKRSVTHNSQRSKTRRRSLDKRRKRSCTWQDDNNATGSRPPNRTKGQDAIWSLSCNPRPATSVH